MSTRPNECGYCNKDHGSNAPCSELDDAKGVGIAEALGLNPDTIAAPLCTYPDCMNSRRTRGLCHQHYQTWRSYARLGKAASDADLMKRGILLPEGEGGSPVKSHEAFLKGNTLTGKAVKS
jgi:hypothetical protein